jgi:hypothetical protein
MKRAKTFWTQSTRTASSHRREWLPFQSCQRQWASDNQQTAIFETAALQQAGAVGMSTYLSASATGPRVVTIDNYTATTVRAPQWETIAPARG